MYSTFSEAALYWRPAWARLVLQKQEFSRLIIEAQSKGSISEKIDFISGALRGTRYLGYTLIGGPQRPEQFIVRDDGFDCVTFCETVLAAARAESHDKFDSVLKTIRYHDGVVSWHERNHYFFEWGQHNVEKRSSRDWRLRFALRAKYSGAAAWPCSTASTNWSSVIGASA